MTERSLENAEALLKKLIEHTDDICCGNWVTIIIHQEEWKLVAEYLEEHCNFKVF